MKYVRIQPANGGIQRLSIPDDAVVNFIEGSYTTYYNGNTIHNPTYAVEIKVGDNVLARIQGVQWWRDESIMIETLDISGEAPRWVAAQ